MYIVEIHRCDKPIKLTYSAFVIICMRKDLIAKECAMKYKKIVTYLLTVPFFVSTFDADRHAEAQPYNATNFKTTYTTSVQIEMPYELKHQIAEQRASELIDIYIDNAVSGVERIIANKKHNKNYNKAVQAELPGAPRNARQGTLHCLYGQYTQLKRALDSCGDTIQIIPKTEDNAHMSSLSFKRHMSKLYNNSEYDGAIHQGHLYPTESEYQKALDRYLVTRLHRQNADNDSLREKYTKEFEKNNYCVTSLNPGTIIIVSSGHAVMYKGQDEKGKAICCAYNKEHASVPLTTWNTKKSFAADIQKIATKKYEDEIDKIISATKDESKQIQPNYIPLHLLADNYGHKR